MPWSTWLPSDVLPEPIHQHYVVVGGRRYPPKQILTCVTGLDRADSRPIRLAESSNAWGSSQHAGKWVALAGPTEVLIAASTPQEVLAWLAKHEQRAPYGMFRVPESGRDAEGAAPL